jgi:hypothetical protein
MPLLSFEYLDKRPDLAAELLGVFTSYVGLHTGKVLLKSVISIEQDGSSLLFYGS